MWSKNDEQTAVAGRRLSDVLPTIPESTKQKVKQLLRSLGFELRRVPQPTQPTELDELVARVRPYTMLSRTRLASLFDQVCFLERAKIGGAFVECGVWKGGAVGLMALANLRYGAARRELHLFDSFSGIPEPDEKVDGSRAISEARAVGVGTTGRVNANPEFYVQSGRGVGTRAHCEALLFDAIGYERQLVHFHAGFFQDTVPRSAGEIGPIALLRLDGDWYASTKVCLDHLYDHVVAGGLVVIDDYGAYDGCRRAVDEFFETRGLRVYLHPVDSELRVFTKPG